MARVKISDDDYHDLLVILDRRAEIVSVETRLLQAVVRDLELPQLPETLIVEKPRANAKTVRASRAVLKDLADQIRD